MGLSFSLAQRIGKTGEHGAQLKLGDHAKMQKALKAYDKRQDKKNGIVNTSWRFSFWSEPDGQCLDTVVLAPNKADAVAQIRKIYPRVKKTVVEYHTKNHRHRHFQIN